MDIMILLLQNRFGRALWNTDSNKSEPVTVRIRLTPKDFVIQREEYVYTHTRDVSVDPNMLARVNIMGLIVIYLKIIFCIIKFILFDIINHQL